jgi:hypothetical protein
MTRRAALTMSAFLLGGCFDPVHDDRVGALGPEAPEVDTGPFHRPGQPCTVCHGGDGPGSPTFGIAGTVFENQRDLAPLIGATVWLVDAAGRTFGLGTNGAGNFWVVEENLALAFPLFASVELAGETVDMKTPIFRARSCAECHADPAGPGSVGHVYLRRVP